MMYRGLTDHVLMQALQSELKYFQPGVLMALLHLLNCAAQARNLFSCSAQYILLAFALAQHKDVYRKSLTVVKQVISHCYTVCAASADL
jgi:hypothetical protein